MPKGTKNYFRHSFYAHQDEKLAGAVSDIGREAYYYYFTLLEFCAAKEVSEKCEGVYIIHERVLQKIWGTYPKHSEKICKTFTKHLLMFAKTSEKIWNFEIPNLLKYLGRYDSFDTEKRANKTKGNKIKEKEIKIKEKDPKNNFDLEAIYSQFRKQTKKAKGLAILRRTVKTQADYDKLPQALLVFNEEQKNTQTQFIPNFEDFCGSWQNYAARKTPDQQLLELFEGANESEATRQ